MATAVGLNMKITADTAGIGRGMNQTEKLLSGLGKAANSAAGSLRALVAIEVGTRLASAFTNAAKSAVDYAATLSQSVAATDDLAKRLGIGVEALQGFQLAAQLSGVDNLEGALQKLSVVLGDAQSGSEAAQKAFGNIGLSAQDLSRLAPEDQFRAVAAAISALPGPAAQAAAAVDLFGRSGVELLPLFAENLAKVEERARNLGIVLSEDQVGAIAEMDDALTLVRSTFDGIISQVTANLAPVVTALAEQFLAFVESFNSFGEGGGTGIADALTAGLFKFALFLAGIFDSAIEYFSQFGVSLETTSTVFERVGNVFYAVSQVLVAAFNVFEGTGNLLSFIFAKLVENLGSFFNEDVEQFGRDWAENAFSEMQKNATEGNQALRRAGQASADAIFGETRPRPSPTEEAAEGPITKFLRDAMKLAEAPQNERKKAERQVAQVADEAVKAEEKRLDAIKRADDEIAKVEEERAKRATEIEADRLDALSRQSTEALNVNDIRSGGISEVLRIAAGREDPAIEEYRKQLAELRKIDQKLAELRAERIQIAG